ncbi:MULTISPECIES: hypothetical protein [Corynebacterium]|uniref:hypothetical protein n=1 Tax=Corynebacterium TaxID=1716 RepID=UPI00114CDAA0|nr:hypothetical protein [Corynebacterium amycolatum]
MAPTDNSLPPERPGMHPTIAHIALEANGVLEDPMDRWELTDEVVDLLSDFAAKYRDSYDYLTANLESWALEGYPNFDVSHTSDSSIGAPIGERLRRKLGPQRPWMCEAKTGIEGKNKKEWRLYFTDITHKEGEPYYMFFGAHFTEKRTKNKRGKPLAEKTVQKMQDSDIKEAATKIVQLTKDDNRDYRLASELDTPE